MITENVAAPAAEHILVFDAKGELQHVIMHPVEPGTEERLEEAGTPFVVTTDEPTDWAALKATWLNPETGEQEPRPAAPLELDKTEILAGGGAATLAGLPAGAELLIDNQPVTGDGSLLRLRGAEPHTYQLVCRHWPFLDWAASLSVRAA